MDYKIISDSGCDLTPELEKEFSVETVPLTMTLGQQTYIDNADLDVDKFLSDMHAYKGQPKSSCPSPYDFIEKCDREKVNFIVTLSSKLSGSYGSANAARSILAEKGTETYVFDSKSASSGQLLVIKKVRELIQSGLQKAEIIRQAEEYIKKMRTFFVLENLENLIKNGRMSKVTGLIAGVLNIRPILSDNGHGEIALFAKVRGARNSIVSLAGTIGEVCRDTKDRVLAIAHCKALEKANTLRDIVLEKYAFKEIIITQTKGLTGMYANEGGIIIAF